MKEQEVRLMISGLLYRIESIFKENEIKIPDQYVSGFIRNHYVSNKNQENIPWILYMADRIAAISCMGEYSFDMSRGIPDEPMQSIFNFFNGNCQNKYLEARMLTEKKELNYPDSMKRKIEATFIERIKEKISISVEQMRCTAQYLDSLLETLEECFSYVPAGALNGNSSDISMYDYMKQTAAVAGCICQYLEETDHYGRFVNNETAFCSEKVFLLYAIDVSGIQNFIYTIHSQKALRMLRARSSYLEIMMEHIIDTILERASLSRCNLMYSGGGHCYLMLPNTEKVRRLVRHAEEEINNWFLDHFGNELYIAGGFAECSAFDFQDEPEGSYSQIFRNMSRKISEKKSHRYSARQIMRLNDEKDRDHSRECKVCKRVGSVDQEGMCRICSALSNLSNHVLYSDFFAVEKEEKSMGVPLPFESALVAFDEEKAGTIGDGIRVYGKNKTLPEMGISKRIWVGDYTTGETFDEFARAAKGMKRIAVLRADVDNLGQAFVGGFQNTENEEKSISLLRTASLSRQLSMFFKYFISIILQKGRKATIVYSGGDDVFIVGAWNEVIEAAADLRNAFDKYTEGTLTFSCGIGLYQPGYPVSAMAREVAELEEESKKLPEKDGITLFIDGLTHKADNGREVSDGTYPWREFIHEVIEEKYACIRSFFDTSEDRGKNFLYHILELIRGRGEKINMARYVYLLSRMEPDQNASEEKRINYRRFSQKMYQWMKSEKDCRQLKTAINLYAYETREVDGHDA